LIAATPIHIGAGRDPFPLRDFSLPAKVVIRKGHYRNPPLAEKDQA
jgi:hypothetical protein